ncbi:MAG: metal-dependent hydrolase [Thermoplasmata archaeon]
MDWIAHISFALILGLVYSMLTKKEVSYSLLSIGAVLPDIFKLHYILMYFVGEINAMNFFAPYHTFLGALLVSLAVSHLFENPFKNTFFTISGGVFTHFFLDGLLWPFGKDVYFFWPFYTFHTTFGLVWPDSYIPTIIFGLGLLLVYLMYTIKNKLSFDKKIKEKNDN